MAGVALGQQFDERFGEIVQFVLVHRPVRAQALRHALRHQLNGGAVQGRARGGHLLRNRVAVAPFGDHALDRRYLPLDAAQTPLNLVHHLVAELKFMPLPPTPGRHGGEFTLRSHAATIQRRAQPLQYPRGYGI